MFKLQVLIFLAYYVHNSLCVMDDLYNKGKKVWELHRMLDKTNLTAAEEPKTIADLFNIYTFERTGEIKHRMLEIHEQLLEIKSTIHPSMIHDLIEIVRSEISLVMTIDRLGTFFAAIDDDYGIFHKIMMDNSTFYNNKVSYLSKSDFSDIESNIGAVRKIITDSDELPWKTERIMSAISNYALNKREELCNSHQPISKILIDLLKLVIIAEMKTNMMWPISNLQRYWEDREWKIVNTLAKKQFKRYFRTYLNIIQENVELTNSLYIRACDPEDGAWILNENYYELNGMRRPMIFRYQPTLCSYKFCPNMWRNRATKCDASYYDKRSGCSKTPTDCKNLGIVQACVLKSGSRHFQFMNSTLLGFFGSNSECPENDGYMIDNTKAPYSTYATCGCYCEENPNKISLVIMDSRMHSNENVITGLRLIRKDNILHIQLKVGRFRANGYIHKSSERWLPVSEDIDASSIHSIDKNNNLFFLDDVFLPPKYVLTGAGFKKVTRGTQTGFAIEIVGISFDCSSGQLSLGEEIKLSSTRKDKQRPLFFLPISPLQTKLPSKPNSSNVTYVQLTESSLRNDLEQSMFPLFDGIPVTTNPPSALSGIGIFHKGAEGHAGFISLRVYGIRYTEYFRNSTHTVND